MIDIQKHIHSFNIGTEEVQVEINCINGYWTSKCIKGKTGTSEAMGGPYATLAEYIKSIEQQHRYSYHFFNHGYKAAKEEAKTWL